MMNATLEETPHTGSQHMRKRLKHILLICSVMGFVHMAGAVGELSSLSYVTNGLVGQWDGIENVSRGAAHDSAATGWADLTGHAGEFPLQDGWAFENGSELKVTRNSYSTVTVSYPYCKPINAWKNALFTGEVAYKQTDVIPASTAGYNATTAILVGLGYSGYFIGLSGSSMCGFKPNNFGRDVRLGGAEYLSVKTLGSHTLTSVQSNTLYSSYFDYDVASGTWELPADKLPSSTIDLNQNLKLGTCYYAYGDYGLVGSYYALRFYDRPLSADEVAINAAIDQVRFFGVSPDVAGQKLPAGYRFNVTDPEHPRFEKRFDLITVGGGTATADDGTELWIAHNAAQEVSLKAVANAGYAFAGWEGDIESIDDASAAETTAVVFGEVIAKFKIDGSAIRAGQYVQDGLIGQWDGIENAGRGVHDPSASVWTDLSGKMASITLQSGWGFGANCLNSTRDVGVGVGNHYSEVVSAYRSAKITAEIAYNLTNEIPAMTQGDEK